jgi:hypothetical protein
LTNYRTSSPVVAELCSPLGGRNSGGAPSISPNIPS